MRLQQIPIDVEPLSGLANEADCGSAPGKRGGGDLPMIEDRILGCNPNVSRQEEFMGNSRYMPLDSNDERL